MALNDGEAFQYIAERCLDTFSEDSQHIAPECAPHSRPPNSLTFNNIRGACKNAANRIIVFAWFGVCWISRRRSRGAAFATLRHVWVDAAVRRQSYMYLRDHASESACAPAFRQTIW